LEAAVGGEDVGLQLLVEGCEMFGLGLGYYAAVFAFSGICTTAHATVTPASASASVIINLIPQHNPTACTLGNPIPIVLNSSINQLQLIQHLNIIIPEHKMYNIGDCHFLEIFVLEVYLL
jgi:hypothetical protein